MGEWVVGRGGGEEKDIKGRGGQVPVSSSPPFYLLFLICQSLFNVVVCMTLTKHQLLQI